jgi:hypothetical protein
MARVTRRAGRSDLPEFPQPVEGLPVLPDDPTEMGRHELMTQMREWTEWANYLTTALAEAEADVLSADAAADEIQVKLGIDLRNKEGRAKAAGEESEALWQARSDLAKAKAKVKRIKAAVDNTERCITLLSRELTRRLQDLGDRRSNK